MSQLDAAEAAIGQVGCVRNGRVTEVLLEFLERLPHSLFLRALRPLAERGDPGAFEPLMRALPGADEQTLPVLLQTCGLTRDPRILQPLLVAAAHFPRQRSYAIDAITSLGPSALSPLVRAAGRDDDVELRCAAIGVLERFADARTVPQLSKLVSDPHLEVRLCAVKALSAIEHESTARPLVAALSDPDAEVRSAAAVGLTTRANAKLAPFLARALNDACGEVRLQAVKGLGFCGEPSLAPRLRPLLSSGDEELELAAAESIARLGDEKIVPDLLDRLEREMKNPGSERGAARIIDALRRLKDDRAVLPLVDMLGHPQETLRARAAEALGQIGEAAAVDSLTDLLLREYSAKVQAAAAKALGELKDPQAIPALEHALQQSPQVRCKALIALGEIGGRRAERSLLELTKDPAPTVRYHAAGALARIGGPAALSALEPLAIDRDEMVRRSALKALQELGDDRSESELVRSAQASSSHDATPPALASRRRFSLNQLVPDIMLGISSRRTGIYLAGVLGTACLIALLVWVGRKLSSDKVVVRGYVSRVSISGDGRTASVVRSLGVFEIWDVDRARVTFQAPDLPFREVVFAPDGSAAIGITGTSLTHLQFDASRRVSEQLTFSAPGDAIATFGTSPGGGLVATISDSGEAVAWNVKTAEGEWSLQLPDTDLNILAVNDEGTRLAAATRRGELLIWNTESGELAGEYAFSNSPPRLSSLSFDGSGRFLAGSADSGQVFIWELERLEHPRVKTSSGSNPRILQFVDSETLLVHAGNELETWTVEGDEPRRVGLDVELAGNVAASVSADGTRVIVGADETKTPYVLDVATGVVEATLADD